MEMLELIFIETVHHLSDSLEASGSLRLLILRVMILSGALQASTDFEETMLELLVHFLTLVLHILDLHKTWMVL